MNEYRIPAAPTKGFNVTATPAKLPDLIAPQTIDPSTSAVYIQNKDTSKTLYVGYLPGAVPPAIADMLDIAPGVVAPFPWPCEAVPDLWLAGEGAQTGVIQQMKDR